MSGGSRPADEGGPVCKKKCLSALRASVSSDNKGEASPPGPFPGSATAYSRSRGGTPIHYLYRYVRPKGVVILKLLI